MKSESLAHTAYTEFRRKILGIQIPPKPWLKEDLWAKKLNVSRMAIPETLSRLLGEELVLLGPKGGYEKLQRTYTNSHIPLFHRRLTRNQNSEDDYGLTGRGTQGDCQRPQGEKSPAGGGSDADAFCPRATMIDES